MFQRVVIGQTVAQCPLELDQRLKEPVMSRPAPQHLPETFDHLEMWTIAGQSVYLHMGPILEHLGNQSSSVPGRIVDHEHHARVLLGRIGSRNITEVAGKPLLQDALLRHALLLVGFCADLFHEARRQPTCHEIEGTKDFDPIMTVEVPYDGSMPFEAQGRAEGGDHGEAAFILAQQDELSRFRFFFNACNCCRAASC